MQGKIHGGRGGGGGGVESSPERGSECQELLARSVGPID